MTDKEERKVSVKKIPEESSGILQVDLDLVILEICQMAHGVKSADPIYERISRLTYCVDRIRTAKGKKSILC